MPLTNAEFFVILMDTSKTIEGDLSWVVDEDHSPSVEFRVEISSESGWPLFIRGSYNQMAGALGYSLILKPVGRIYGLDLGTDHKDPHTRQLVGKKHKHKWNEPHKARETYDPTDITAPLNDPIAVWKQFCIESKIEHKGEMHAPPPVQKDLLI